jgi:thiol:disulfide interchange protein DsbD
MRILGMLRILVLFIIVLFNLSAYAAQPIKPLSPEQAFEFSSTVSEDKQLILEWNIAPGYYLYRDQMDITLAPTSEVKLHKIKLPKGKIKKMKSMAPLRFIQIH